MVRVDRDALADDLHERGCVDHEARHGDTIGTSRRAVQGVGSRVVSASAPTVVVCASSTPPTGTWAGRSTARACSPPGGVRRPPARGRRVRAGRPGRGRRRRLRPRAAPGRRRPARRRDAGPAGRVARPGRADQRQPRLRAAARLQLAADRRRRRLHPHRRRPASAPRSLLDDEHGPVAVYGLPYLDPTALREPWGLPARSHEAALTRRDAPGPRRPRRPRPRHPLGGAGARVRRRRRAQRVRARHQRRRGVRGADRRCSTASTTPRSATSTARQTLTDRVRYSGSPLAYSFSEAAHTKGSWLVDLDGDGRRRPRRSWTRRSPAGWPGCAGTLEDLLADPALAAHEACWVQATLTDAIRPPQPMERLRAPVPARPGARVRARQAAMPPTCRPRGPGSLGPRDRPRLRPRAARDARDRRRVRAAPRRLRRLLRRPRRRRPALGRGRSLMRLHRLEVTAFGPFAETATVDFDALCGRGAVPALGRDRLGQDQRPRRRLLRALRRRPRRPQRRQAAALRPGRRRARRRGWCSTRRSPGRRFRIDRSPAWERPKRRGTGTTPQQASVVDRASALDGGWVPLSTRLDETGHLVTALLGMNLAQFTQVAMLPQGRFQAFLRAVGGPAPAAPAALPHRPVRARSSAGCATAGSRCAVAARSTSRP